eukprot:1158635-Pelagomonas_calceolata.AAC.9
MQPPQHVRSVLNLRLVPRQQLLLWRLAGIAAAAALLLALGPAAAPLTHLDAPRFSFLCQPRVEAGKRAIWHDHPDAKEPRPSPFVYLRYLRPYLILSFHFLLAPLPQCTSKAVAAIVLAGWQLEHASQKHDTCARQRKTSRKGTTIILRPKEKYCMNFNTQALGIHLPGRTPGTCSPGLCYRTPQGAATPALRQAAPQVAVQLALLLEHAPLGCCPERPQASE